MDIVDISWLGHLDNSTLSIPPTEIWTRMLSTRIKLLQVHFGLWVWGAGESSRGLAVGGMGQGVSEQEDVATAGDVCVL
jgi:hypothetical protein